MQKYRLEHDLLGNKQVPIEAYYGVQTVRAMENFVVSKIPISNFPTLIQALGYIKKATALANMEYKILDPEVGKAIIEACDEIIAGKFLDQFPVDAIQGGAGTSTNMNANEVIANRALELLGKEKGDYKVVHPNNHVNLSQSTNDVYPTSIRMVAAGTLEALLSSEGFRVEYSGTWGGWPAGMRPLFLKRPIDAMAKRRGWGDVMVTRARIAGP